MRQRRRCAVIRLSVVKRTLGIGRSGGGDDSDESDIPIGMSCHVYSEGDGWLIHFPVADADKSNRAPSSLPWKNAKAKLSFCQVTQDGDWEGCLRLHRLPDQREAKAIREALGIRSAGTYQPIRRNGLMRPSVGSDPVKSAKRPPPMLLAA